MKTTGIPVVISAPSGGGKSTIASLVVKQSPSAVLSISYTTRPIRPGEKEGVDYYFTTAEDFKSRDEQGGFLESAVVHGHHYGTPLSNLERQLAAGKDVILTIDPRGARHVKHTHPNGIFIFVVPPTWETLVNRLTKRATDEKAVLDIRINNARKELSDLSQYDYLVVNDDLNLAVKNVVAIIQAEHLKMARIDKNSIPILSHGVKS